MKKVVSKKVDLLTDVFTLVRLSWVRRLLDVKTADRLEMKEGVGGY